jgi:hypothetical protein
LENITGIITEGGKSPYPMREREKEKPEVGIQ